MNKQNKKLKRQSQHILLQLGTLDIDITEEEEGEGEGEGKEKVEEQQEHWNRMIDGEKRVRGRVREEGAEMEGVVREAGVLDVKLMVMGHWDH